jgi:hypothetical protein
MPNTARGLPRECHPCQSVQDRDADAIGSVPSWRWPRLARTKRSRVPRFSYSATFGPSCSLILPAMNMTRGKRRGRNTLTSQSPGLTLALASMRVVVVDLRNHIVSGNASSRRRLHHFYRLNGASMTTLQDGAAGFVEHHAILFSNAYRKRRERCRAAPTDCLS